MVILNIDSVVVFYVYVFQKILSLSSYFILIFDMIIINVGDSFYYYFGIFFIFCIGFYVFIWLFRLQNDVYVLIEFVVNNVVKGLVYFDVYLGVGGNLGGIVVVYVN